MRDANGLFMPDSRADIADKQRWQDRYGDPPYTPGSIVYLADGERVQIGDEIYKVADLEKAHEEHPQPTGHYFKPHHYLVQKSMDELKAYFKKHPDRKPMRLR